MGDQLVAQIQDALEGPIDFEGQKLTEQLSTWLITATGVVAFIIGLIADNVYYTLWSGLLGTFITFIVVIPPWPFYNKHPVQWAKNPNDIRTMDIKMGKK